MGGAGVITIYPEHPIWYDLLWLGLVALVALLIGLLIVLAMRGHR
jgi:hypothetical protein